MKRVIFLGTLLTLTSILFSLQTLYVNITSSTGGAGTLASPFQQIYTAISCMNPNEAVRIIVYPGDYGPIVISGRTSNLTIESRYYEAYNSNFIGSTMIHGNTGTQLTDSACEIINCVTPGVSIYLKGFTLKNGGGTLISANGHNERRGGGVFCKNAINVNIDHCDIRNNTALHGGGIALMRGSSSITNCKIYSNSVADDGGYDSSGGGLYIEEGTHTIQACGIYTNSAPAGYAGAFEVNHAAANQSNAYNVLFGSCLVYDNFSHSCAIYAADAFNFLGPDKVRFIMDYCTVAHNHISSTNAVGVYFERASGNLGGQAVLSNCIIYHNQDAMHNDLPIQLATNGAFGSSNEYPQTITYCDIGNTVYPTINTGTINLDPGFKNLEADDFSLAWEPNCKSPCIDSGDPQLPDADNTRSDMGALPVSQETRNYKFYGTDSIHHGWTWLCYPVLDVYDTNPQIGNVMSHLSGTGVLDYEVWSNRGTESSFLYSSSSWQNSNHIITSPQGYKALITTPADYSELSITAPRCSPDTPLHLYGNRIENWVGYFLPESQSPEKALASIWANVYSIQTQTWFMARTKDGWMISSGKRQFNYGDMAIIKCYNEVPSFIWNRINPIPHVVREIPEYFTFNEKADYLPVFIALGAETGLKEIAVYADGVCKGASVVDDTLMEINAYVLDLPEDTELEIVKYYASKAGLQHISTAYVYDPQTRVITQSPLKLHKGDDYLYAGTRLSFMTPAAEVPIRMTCYPNPFNPSTVIEYNTVKAGSSSLQIYNVKGQLVKTLWDGWQTEGSHKIKWDGNNENGEAVSSGIYFARLQTAEHQVMKKLMLLK